MTWFIFTDRTLKNIEIRVRNEKKEEVCSVSRRAEMERREALAWKENSLQKQKKGYLDERWQGLQV